MTDLYLDTEFNDFGGELISIALVDGDRTFYEVVEIEAPYDPWVAENVVPILNRNPITREQLRYNLFKFLGSIHDELTIYADWYTDLVHFFELFAGPDHTTSIDYGCKAVLLHNVPNLEHEWKHNAMADARALRRWHLSQNPSSTHLKGDE